MPRGEGCAPAGSPGPGGLPAQLPWEVSSAGELGLRVGTELISKCERTHLHAVLIWLPCLCACRRLCSLSSSFTLLQALSSIRRQLLSLHRVRKKPAGKCWALRAVLAAQTCVPCFLQVSRESGSATAMSLAESSTCTAFKWFAYHQWYTTVWEPLV